ncbi:MAG: sulfatase-like hydrolase/transferase [Pirellulaceae bacterium]
MPDCRLLARLVLALVALCWLPVSLSADQPPNVIIIFSDDQGVHDIGCYGSEIPTPNIDRIAAEGMKFNQWYVASSICTPSRFGLLTGRNPDRSQDKLLGALMFLGDRDKDRGIRPQETTFPSLLKKQGYDTALIGKWHLGHGDAKFLPNNHGFDKFIGHTAGCIDFFTMRYGKFPDWYHDSSLVDEVGYATHLITDEAVDYLKGRGEDAKKPFFLHLAYNAPHYGKGWDPGKQEAVNLMQAHPDDLARVPESDDIIRRQFAAMVMAMDDGIGRVLDTLDETGQAENTLVIFMTDHGGDPNYGGSNLPLRGSKATLFDGGLRVPCVMRWPGKIEPGSECNEVASALDIFPTLCHLAGASTESETLDGLNITPLLHGQADNHPERTLIWHLGQHAELNRGQWWAVRTGDWKLVIDRNQEEYLFDLATDPNEKKNLREEKPEAWEKVKGVLEGHIAEVWKE